MNSFRRWSQNWNLFIRGTCVLAIFSGVRAVSYALMNPRSERATLLTPSRFASSSYACALEYLIHLYFRDGFRCFTGLVSVRPLVILSMEENFMQLF